MKQSGKMTPGYIEILFMVLIVVAGALFLYDTYFVQKIKVVDMDGFLRQQKQLMADGKITTDQFKANLDQIESLINKDAAANKNQLYILKEVVLKNGNEIILK